jgi:hypothetical protein
MNIKLIIISLIEIFKLSYSKNEQEIRKSDVTS